MRLFGPLARGAKSIDSTGQRELRGAEARDEVAAPNAARVLHGLQDAVRRREPSAGPFRPNDLARENPVPLEQLPDLGCRAFGRGDRRVAGGIGQRPSSGNVVADREALEAAHMHRATD